jgi:hypothetical protein
MEFLITFTEKIELKMQGNSPNRRYDQFWNSSESVTSWECQDKQWLVFTPDFRFFGKDDINISVKGISEIADNYVNTLDELWEFITVKMSMKKDIKFITFKNNAKLQVIADLREIPSDVTQLYAHDYYEFKKNEEIKFQKYKDQSVVLFKSQYSLYHSISKTAKQFL